MKSGFTGNLIKRLIMQNDFILAADESGNPVINSDFSILTKYVSGSFILLEILDGINGQPSLAASPVASPAASPTVSPGRHTGSLAQKHPVVVKRRSALAAELFYQPIHSLTAAFLALYVHDYPAFVHHYRAGSVIQRGFHVVRDHECA